jgi:hypothetical protein
MDFVELYYRVLNCYDQGNECCDLEETPLDPSIMDIGVSCMKSTMFKL